MRRTALIVAVAATTACGVEGGRDVTLHVRTELPEALRDYVERTFEEEMPTVDVRFSEEPTDRSLEQLSGANGVTSDRAAPFDVWWGAPVRALEAAADAELFLPNRPAWVGEPEANPVRADDAWQVTLMTPYVLAFNRDEMQLSRAPTDWLDVFHFRWADDIQVLDPTRSSAGAWFVGSVLARHADSLEVETGFDWLARLDGQVDVYATDLDVAFSALRSGASRLAILPRADVEARRADDAPWLYYRIPDSGSPVQALGVAIVRSSDVPEAARAFVEHLGRIDVATIAKRETRWQPAYGNVDSSLLPDDFELAQSWRPYPLLADAVERDLEGWVERWEREIRGRR